MHNDDNDDETAAVLMCEVIAPSALPEHYEFTACVDGITFAVTVPEGGATEGQILQVPYPSLGVAPETEVVVMDNESFIEPEVDEHRNENSSSSPPDFRRQPSSSASTPTAVTSTTNTMLSSGNRRSTSHHPTTNGTNISHRLQSPSLPSLHKNQVIKTRQTITTLPDNRTRMVITETMHADGTKTIVRERTSNPEGAPMGEFRNPLCRWYETVDTWRCWVGCCCVPVLMGQVMQRMRLNLCGCPTEHHQSTCTYSVILHVVLLFVSYIMGALQKLSPFFALFGSVPVTIWMTIAGFFARQHFRRRYQILPAPPLLLWGLDSVVSFFCSCCLAIQMSRHTHQEVMFPYDPCSPTGIRMDAPEIV